MNLVESQFISILNSYVEDKKTNVVLKNKVTWSEILEESKAHRLGSIVYSSIKWDENTTHIDKEVKSSWRSHSMHKNISQIEGVKKAGLIFDRFNEKNIKFIVLKGLIVRNFYKRPELRTMGDIDILIHKDDLEKTSKLLGEFGYKKNGEAGHHIDFKSKEYPPIEVHWRLINKDYFKKEAFIDKYVWENTVETYVSGVKVLSLNLEYLLTHLCMHMAVHMAVGGFGIRQLLDLVLIIKEKRCEIDWMRFKELVKENSIDKFAYSIFLMCHSIFHMDMPKELENEFNIDNESLSLLIDDVLKNGINGKRDKMYSFKSQAAFDLDEESSKGSVLKRYIRFLFPPMDKMSKKFNYAKRFKLLIPVAWIHHFFCGLTNKKFTFRDKVRFFTVNIVKAYKKNKLIKWLEL